jgi:hypothetical protein
MGKLVGMDVNLVPDGSGWGMTSEALKLLSNGLAVTDNVEYASRDECRKRCSNLSQGLRYHVKKGTIEGFRTRTWTEDTKGGTRYRWAILPA